mgnify:FL=1
MTILPVAYLPSVAYMTHLLKEECIIDLHEHYIKRSERNRARILASSGVMELTAHLRQANRPQTPVRDLRLDYSKRWQHQHAVALLSAYKSSPYFDYYWDLLAPFYERKYDFLVDYDLEILRRMLAMIVLESRMPRLSERYVEAAPGDCDLRPKRNEGPDFGAEPYVQVFSDRLPFAANLSAIDLWFAEGPSARDVLSRCRIG